MSVFISPNYIFQGLSVTELHFNIGKDMLGEHGPLIFLLLKNLFYNSLK